ncbi:MAG: hypothetical protein EHM46_00930, partial [Bacteroidetes bacterium]
KDSSTIWILTQEEGIYRFLPERFDLQAEVLALGGLPVEGGQQVYEDRNGNLWIPSFGNGLYRLNRGNDGSWSQTRFHEENGLPGNNVKCVLEDREGNIGAGMYGTGLVRLADEAFAIQSFDREGPGNNVTAICIADSVGWYGTGRGVIRVDRNGGEVRLLEGPGYGLPGDAVSAITVSPSGDLWIGTAGSGIYRLSAGGKRFIPQHVSDGALENVINAMDFHGSHLWIATGKGVCGIFTGTGETRWFTISNGGLPHNTVNDLEVDASGRVWLSTLSNTVCYIENDSVTRMIIPVGGAMNIRSITRDPAGDIWVGTYGNGVFHLVDDSAFNFTAREGLLSDYCYSLESDDHRYIWVTHRGGLSRIGIEDGHIGIVREEAGIDAGMDFNLNAVFRDHEGVLWFGSSRGVLSYDPDREKGLPPPPALTVTRITANDRPLDPAREIHLPPGRHDLRIGFSGISLKDPDGVRYSYYMEGLGDNWSEPFTENQQVFNKVPDGKYKFLLRAMNREGIHTEDPLEISIVIARPLWKRGWFYLLLLMLMTAAVVSVIRQREHHLLMEKEALEQAVRERTGEVVRQKEEIEIQRDAIKLQNERIRSINKNLTDSINYARRIQQAVFTPPERLHAFFPDHLFIHRPQNIVSGDFLWLGEKEGKVVFTVADCTGHGVPGAFMSMLGITLLNEIVNQPGKQDAGQILDRLKFEIINALRQQELKESHDGIDIALCVYDPSAFELQYAGGFNPLILVSRGELTKISADPMPVGIGAISGRNFTRHTFNIRKGDVVYLFSDGYEDQFGGPDDKKFSRGRYRDFLLEIHHLPMEEQKRMLEQSLDAWQGDQDQTDDITVLGIRF